MLERTRSRADEDFYFANASDEREIISLSDIVAFIRRFWLTVAFFVAAGILGAVFYVSTTNPKYVASAQILIEPKIAPLLSQQPSDINLSLDTAQMESQIAVLESEKIAKMVIDELKLEDDPIFLRSPAPSLLERIKVFARIIRDKMGRDDSQAASADKSVAANADESTSTKTQDTVAHTTEEQTAVSSHSQRAEFIKSRLAMYFFRSSLNIRRVGVSYAIEISFTSLNPELSALVANSVADAYMREQIENKAMEARAGTAWLENRLGELRRLMNEATKAEQEFRVRHDYSIQSSPDNSNGAATDTGQNPGDLNSDIREPTMEELEVTSDTYKKMYESFLQAYTNSVNQQTFSPPNARIITAATAPLDPSYPRPKLAIVFGILAGLFAGVGIAFTRQTLDSSIRSQQQIRDIFGLECLGELPPLPRLPNNTSRFDAVTLHPPSAFSHSLASIKTVINFSRSDRPIRLLGVVSASSGEGKSMLAGNLAAMSAANGIRTLVIDADIHQSTLSNNLPQPESKFAGFDVGNTILDNIVPVEGNSFDLLSSKAIVRNRILSPGELKAALDTLDIYDLIIFDLPDLDSGADGMAICALLDGVVISTKWGKTSISELGELVKLLRSLKTSILGVVITNHAAKARLVGYPSNWHVFRSLRTRAVRR